MPEDAALLALIAQHTPKPRQRTETSLVQRLIALAPKLRAKLWRNQVGTYKLADGRYITSGLCVGSSDLIGYRTLTIGPEHVGQQIAQFVAIEAKAARGVATDRQQAFIANVTAAGGIGQIVKSEQELKIVLTTHP